MMQFVVGFSRLFCCAAFAFSVLISLQAFAVADNPLGAAPVLAGKYSNDKVTVDLSGSAGGYVGTISMGPNEFPAKATASGRNLTGTFTASGEQYAFTATLSDNQLTLVSGGKSYVLTRAAQNPLGAGNTATEPDAKTAPVQSLGAFSILGSTATGQTLFIKLPGATTLESAITQTADALGKVLDAKPEVTGAFADAKTKSKGGALLTGKLKGKDVHGWIFSSIPAAGAKAGVTACAVIAPADASPQDVQTLFAFMPAQMNMKEHDFPDGSGSVELPPGWTTQEQGLTYGARVIGPAGQMVIFQGRVVVSTPDGNYAQIAQKNYESKLALYRLQMNNYEQSIARHRQFPNIPMMPEPRKPEPPDLQRLYPGTTFCRVCSGAEEVLKYFYPAAEKRVREAGGPYSTLDKVLEVTPVDPNPLIPGSKAGVAYLAVTDHAGDKITHVRALVRMDTNPVLDGKDKWVVAFNTVRAPDAAFDRDLPVMMEIANSFKVNLDVVNKTLTHDGDVIRKMGEENQYQLLKRGREFNEQQAHHFAQFESQMQAQSQARHDANSDFIEYIGGVRTVYNTRTGETANVDLFNANAIVNAMNAAANSPNENVQIPLRYQR